MTIEHNKNAEKLFTPDFLKIMYIVGIGRICNHMQSITMPLYMQSIGFNATMAGLMGTVYSVSSLCSRPFIGLALDRWRRWPIVVGGTALFAVCSGLFGFVHSLALLFAVRFFHGLGFAIHATGSNTMGTDVMPVSRLSEGIGYLGLTNSLSTAIAPAMALFLISTVSYSRTFLLIFLLAATGVLACVSVRYEKNAPPRAKKAEGKRVRWTDLFEKTSLLPSIIILFLSCANTALNTFLATYGTDRGIGQVGLFFTFSAASMAVARLTCGRLSQKFSERRITKAGMLLCIGGYLLLFFSATKAGLWVSGIVYGFGYGVVYPVVNAMAVVNAAPERRGAANATFLTFLDVGIALGSLIWGISIDFFGVRWLYLLCAICVAACYGLNLLPRFAEMYEKKS